MLRRLALVLLLLGTLSAEVGVFVEGNVGEDTTTLRIFPYNVSDSTAQSMGSAVSSFKYNIKLRPVTGGSGITTSCQAIRPIQQEVDTPFGRSLLQGVECSITTPDFLKEDCSRGDIYVAGSIANTPIRGRAEDVYICPSRVAYKDTAVSALSRLGLNFSNPICFSALVLLALFMAAFYARGGGMLISLYDFIFPKTMSPPEPSYSLRGVSPVGSVMSALAKPKATLKKEIESIFKAMGHGKVELTDKKAALGLIVELLRGRGVEISGNDAEADLVKFFSDAENRREYGAIYSLFRMVAQYFNMDEALNIIKKTRKEGFLLKGFNKISGAKDKLVGVVPDRVRMILKKPLGYAVMPLKFASDIAIKKGKYGLSRVPAALMEVSGVGGIVRGAYRGLRRTGELAAMKEKGGLQERIATGLEKAAKAAVSGEYYLLMNYGAFLEGHLAKARELYERAMFAQELYRNLSEEDKQRFQQALDRLSSIDIVGGEAQSNREALESVIQELQGVLSEQDIRNAYEAAHNAYRELLAGMELDESSLTTLDKIEVIGQLLQMAERIEGPYRVGSDEDIGASNYYRQMFFDVMYNQLGVMGLEYWSEERIGRLIRNSVEYPVALDINYLWGVDGSKDGKASEEFWKAAFGEENEELAKNAYEHAQWARELLQSIFSGLFIENGFDVSDDELYAFLSREMGKREMKMLLEKKVSEGQASEEAMRNVFKMLDYLSVSKETRVREREGERATFMGAKWNYIEEGDAKKVKEFGLMGIEGGELSYLLGGIDALKRAARGYEEEAIGVYRGIDVRELSGWIDAFVDSARDAVRDAVKENNVAETALLEKIRDGLKELRNFDFDTKRGREEAQAFVEKVVNEAIKEISQNFPDVDVEALQGAFYGPAEGQNRVELLKSVVANLDVREVKVRSAFHGVQSIRRKSLMEKESNATNYSGFDRSVFIHSIGLHFIDYYLSMNNIDLEEVGNMRDEISEFLNKDMKLDRFDLEDAEAKGFLFLRTNEGFIIPLKHMTDEGARNDRMDKIIKGLGMISLRNYRDYSNYLPPKTAGVDGILGLEKIYIVLNRGSDLIVENFLEFRGFSSEELIGVAKILEEGEVDRETIDLILELYGRMREGKLSVADREQVQEAMSRLMALIKEGRLNIDVTLPMRLAYAYLHESGDMSLLLNTKISGAVIGTREQVYNAIKNAMNEAENSNAGTLGLIEKAMRSLENLTYTAKYHASRYSDIFLQELSSFSVSVNPMPGMESFLVHTETSKYASQDFLEYVEKMENEYSYRKEEVENRLKELRQELESIKQKIDGAGNTIERDLIPKAERMDLSTTKDRMARLEEEIRNAIAQGLSPDKASEILAGHVEEINGLSREIERRSTAILDALNSLRENLQKLHEELDNHISRRIEELERLAPGPMREREEIRQEIEKLEKIKEELSKTASLEEIDRLASLIEERRDSQLRALEGLLASFGEAEDLEDVANLYENLRSKLEEDINNYGLLTDRLSNEKERLEERYELFTREITRSTEDIYKAELRFLDSWMASLKNAKEATERYMDLMSYYSGAGDYYIYGGIMGSKEATLAKYKHGRGIYLPAMLTEGILDHLWPDVLSQTPNSIFTAGGAALVKAYKRRIRYTEVFRKFSALAASGSMRALTSPSPYDLVYEMDKEMEERLEERYGMGARSASKVARAKDAYLHYTKTDTAIRRANSFRSLADNIMAYGFPVGATILAGLVLPGGLGIAATATGILFMGNKFSGWVRKRIRKGEEGAPLTFYENFIVRRLFSEEVRKATYLEEQKWKAMYGASQQFWYSWEGGKVQSGGIPGISYFDVLTGEYKVGEGMWEAYRRHREAIEGISTDETKTARQLGAELTRKRMGSNILMALELQLKELEGYDRRLHFTYGLLSPALAMPFLGSMVSRAAISARRGPRDIFKSGMMVAVPVAAGMFFGIPGVAFVGSAFAAGEVSRKGFLVRCIRCHQEKRRGLRCPHCGFKPASPNF